MSGGLSPARLARMHEIMAGHVAKGLAPGLVTLISRRGESHVDAIGTQALGSPAPMRRDTIFRITSMTKPITAVAALILVEECKLRLDDPVDRFLPELADRRVLKSLEGAVDDTEPARRAITLRDLLTFRSGYGFVFGSPEKYPILKAIAELGIVGFGPPDHTTPLGPDEWIKRLGTLPLLHQPGEKWLYNTGAYILGVLIARAAGQSFASFLAERIFAPLGMKDTAFFVPAAKRDRLAASYWVNEKTGALDLYDGIGDTRWAKPPAFADGGAGLVSTVDDYLAFAQMLLNKGKRRHDAHPVAVRRRAHDCRSADARAKGGIGFPARGLAESRLGLRRRRRHRARRAFHDARKLRLERRLRHRLGERSQGRDDRDPHVAARAVSGLFADLSRFLDHGLSYNRRLKAEGTVMRFVIQVRVTKDSESGQLPRPDQLRVRGFRREADAGTQGAGRKLRAQTTAKK
ncbi:MAG TPA: serine hydrolase domain-containing protein [Stellaceae bacterium]|nr:serine hydrolase domain-containing protein [Stellaceae bacterium]